MGQEVQEDQEGLVDPKDRLGLSHRLGQDLPQDLDYRLDQAFQVHHSDPCYQGDQGDLDRQRDLGHR